VSVLLTETKTFLIVIHESRGFNPAFHGLNSVFKDGDSAISTYGNAARKSIWASTGKEPINVCGHGYDDPPSGDGFSLYLCLMTYPPAPTTFDELMKLIPPRDTITKHRFTIAEKPFELQIGRSSENVVWLEFCVPEPPWQFWPRIRTVESLTSQRAIWLHWQKFLADPDMYLTWKYIGKAT